MAIIQKHCKTICKKKKGQNGKAKVGVTCQTLCIYTYNVCAYFTTTLLLYHYFIITLLLYYFTTLKSDNLTIHYLLFINYN